MEEREGQPARHVGRKIVWFLIGVLLATTALAMVAEHLGWMTPAFPGPRTIYFLNRPPQPRIDKFNRRASLTGPPFFYI